MGEKKAFIFGMIIFFCFFLPAGVDWFVHDVKSDQFLKSATEFQQLVQSQGGYTSVVHTKKQLFESNGLHIKVTSDRAGNTPIGVSDVRLKPGTKIFLSYRYERTPIFNLRQDKRVLQTTNEVIINRR